MSAHANFSRRITCWGRLVGRLSNLGPLSNRVPVKRVFRALGLWRVFRKGPAKCKVLAFICLNKKIFLEVLHGLGFILFREKAVEIKWVENWKGWRNFTFLIWSSNFIYFESASPVCLHRCREGYRLDFVKKEQNAIFLGGIFSSFFTSAIFDNFKYYFTFLLWQWPSF